MAKNDDLYLTGTFTEISTEIAIDFLKPGLIFRVDHFFLDHWLVVYIRCHCHADDNERGRTFSMRKAELAAGLGVSGRTLPDTGH